MGRRRIFALAVKNAAAGKSAFSLLPLAEKPPNKAEQIRLDGQSPKSAEDWQRIESHAVLRRQTRKKEVRTCWLERTRADCPSPLLRIAPAEALRMTEEILGQMAMVERWVMKSAQTWREEVQAVFADVGQTALSMTLIEWNDWRRQSIYEFAGNVWKTPSFGPHISPVSSSNPISLSSLKDQAA